MGVVSTYTGPGKQRSNRSRARESWGVIVTTATECQWYSLANRPTYSASPWVVGGAGLKQMIFTWDIGRGQRGPESGVPKEIARKGARCCLARRKATVGELPGLSSSTIALTRDGIPWSGQTNNRAVAAITAIRTTTSTTRALRHRLGRCDGRLTADSLDVTYPASWTTAPSPLAVVGLHVCRNLWPGYPRMLRVRTHSPAVLTRAGGSAATIT